ncbi:hypothetical protein D7S44_20875 [Pantoea piersonii]|nr:hypothetical protein D7S44_20875 [Pantoea piersonii]
MPQLEQNVERRPSTSRFFHDFTARIARIFLWITLCAKIITLYALRYKMSALFIKHIKINVLFYYRDRVCLSTQGVAYVDIKFRRMRMDYFAK